MDPPGGIPGGLPRLHGISRWGLLGDPPRGFRGEGQGSRGPPWGIPLEVSGGGDPMQGPLPGSPQDSGTSFWATVIGQHNKRETAIYIHKIDANTRFGSFGLRKVTWGVKPCWFRI